MQRQSAQSHVEAHYFISSLNIHLHVCFFSHKRISLELPYSGTVHIPQPTGCHIARYGLPPGAVAQRCPKTHTAIQTGATALCWPLEHDGIVTLLLKMSHTLIIGHGEFK